MSARKDQKVGPEENLEAVMSHESLLSVMSEITEVGVDTLLDDGLLKEVPVLSTLVGLIKSVRSIGDFLFVKKLIKFLNETKRLDSEKRRKFIESIKTNPKENRKVGEAILTVLERADDVDKAEIIGKIYCRCVEGHMAYDLALRLIFVVNRAYISDLRRLANHGSGAEKDKYLPDILLSLGLATIYEDGMRWAESNSAQRGNIKLNKWGLDLISVLREKWPPK